MDKARRELHEFLAAELEGSDEPTNQIIERLLPAIERREEWRRLVMWRGIRWMLTTVSSVGRLSKTTRARLGRRAQLRQAPLVNWRLETGKRLGDAVRADLIRSAELLEISAGGSLARAIFYRRLAAGLATERTPVRRKFSNAQIEQEFRDCEVAAAAAVEMAADHA
jgi:hypothetical protein